MTCAMNQGRSWTASLLLVLIGCVTAHSQGWAVTVAGRTAGEFKVDASGSANYYIPLWTPPGVNGLEQRLALVYNSRTGNGLYGVGWTVTGLSVITRCTRTWAQDNGSPGPIELSNNDKFCLDGQRLRLSSSGTYGAAGTTYGTEIGPFARVTAAGSQGNGPASFKVEGKDSLIYEYGITDDSRIEASGSPGTTVAYWAISKISDRVGNSIQFVYLEDTTNHTFHLSQITYPHTATGQGPYYRIRFVYENRSNDTLTGYVAGYKWTETQRVDYVTIESQDGGSWPSVRKYDLFYLPAPVTGRTRLVSMNECAGTNCFEGSNFNYQNGEADWEWEHDPYQTVALMADSILMDFNGDGRDDLVYPVANGNFFVSAADGTDNGFSAPINTGVSAANYSTALPIDFNSDGNMDLLVKNGSGNWRALVSTGTTFSVVDNVGAGSTTVTATGAGGNAWVADYDGDGRSDLIYAINPGTTSSALRGRRQTPTGFSATIDNLLSGIGFGEVAPDTSVFGSPQQRFRTALRVTDFDGDHRSDLFMRVYVTTGCYDEYCPPPTRVYYWAAFRSNGTSYQMTGGYLPAEAEPLQFDFNNDGYTDVVYASGPYWYIQLGSGTGTFSQVNTTVPVGAASHAKLADWNGDGRTDLIVSLDGTYYYARSTGVNFADPVSLGITDTAGVTDNVKLADINGDGLSDWVYNNSGNGLRFRRHKGQRADLVTDFIDGFQIKQDPQYVSIAQGSYTKSTGASFPYQDFQGPLYVVNSVTASTGNGGTYTETYTYAGARIHVQGRGFAGFGHIVKQDSRNGFYHHQYFKQDFPYIGLRSKDELYQGDATTPVNKMEVNTWDELSFTPPGDSRYFPYAKKATRTSYEVGGSMDGSAISERVTETTLDAFGNATYQKISTKDLDPNLWQYQTYITEITMGFEPDTSGTNYCVGIPNSTTVKSTLPDLTSQTRTQSAEIDYSLCRAGVAYVQPGVASPLQVTTTIGYDDCGNVDTETVVGRKPDGSNMAERITRIGYGTRCQLPETIENAEGHTTGIVNRYDLGLPERITDPNGLATTTIYDDFGRVNKVTQPDYTYTLFSLARCTSTGSYCGTGANDVRFETHAVEYTNTDQQIRDSYMRSDGLGRTRFALATHPFGGHSLSAVTYDAFGRPDKQYVPVMEIGGLAGYRQMTYDTVGRPLSDGLYDFGGTPERVTNITFAGRKISETDPRQKTTDRYYDVVGNLRRVQEPSPDGSAPRPTTNYTYYPFGELASVTDPGNITIARAINNRGFLTSTTDADRGNRVFTVNSLGEVITETDAKSQTFTVEYDKLSRPKSRIDHTDGTTTWIWGTSAALHEIGRLKSLSGPGYSETTLYDTFGRPSKREISADVNYAIDLDYSPTTGLLDSLTYPASINAYRFKVKYDYTNGFLTKLSDSNQPLTTFWELADADAFGHPINEMLGNGAHVISSYDPLTGLIDSRTAGTNASFDSNQNISFEWDANGNLDKRIDHKQSNLQEKFYYDNLNRLDYSTLNSATNANLEYYANGNPLSAQFFDGTGIYHYDSSHPHAVTSVVVNCGCACGHTWSYDYDANGNMTHLRNGAPSYAVTWYSYNLPQTIGQGPSSTTFSYAPDRSRWRQVANYNGTSETTIYIGGLMEKVILGGTTTYKHYLAPSSSATIVHSRTASGNATYYVANDHLGSSTTVMNSGGASLVNLSFAAFGKRRGSAWQGTPSTADFTQITNTTRRGFTGHESLDSVSLVHMNGRVFEPEVGRFLSPDPVFLGDLAHPQSLNPYSYISNNPLSGRDPSGYSAGMSGWDMGMGMSGDFHAALDFDNLIVDLDLAVRAYQGQLATWAHSCGTAGGSCNDSVPLPSGINAAAQGVISGSVAMQSYLYHDIQSAEQIMNSYLDNWHQNIHDIMKDQKTAWQSRDFWKYVANLDSNGATGRGALSRSSLEGPEIPASERKAIIDNAIETYYRQPGRHLLLGFSNRYDSYYLTNSRGQYHSFESLGDANNFSLYQWALHGIEWKPLAGWSSGIGYTAIYAAAAYPHDESYGTPVIPELYTLFTVWHEAGHSSWFLGGGNCFDDEQCANDWAISHYQP